MPKEELAFSLVPPPSPLLHVKLSLLVHAVVASVSELLSVR